MPRKSPEKTEKPDSAKKPNNQKNLEVKVRECLTVAELFYVMNDTKWNVLDDCFFLIGRRWFEHWKSFIAYDYIVQKLITEKSEASDLSKNKIYASGSSNPGEVSNWGLLLESSKYLNRAAAKDDSNYTPLKENIKLDWDFIMVPVALWDFFRTGYSSPVNQNTCEIKRYSIIKDRVGRLFRTPKVPLLKLSILTRGE
jgi:hypothetical protein